MNHLFRYLSSFADASSYQHKTNLRATSQNTIITYNSLMTLKIMLAYHSQSAFADWTTFLRLPTLAY